MTNGMMVHGFETQVASATMPGFRTWASIWLKPAAALLPAPSGIRIPAGRVTGAVDDVTDAKEELLDASLYAGPDDGLVKLDLACASAASALAFWAGRRVETRNTADCLAALAASSEPCRSSTMT